MDEQQVQIQEEVALLLDIIIELTEFKPRWSGHVLLVPEAEFKGKKPFPCDIVLNAALVSQPQRWSTLIHECLHCCSAGYLREDYQKHRGWEEGVVEQLQRLLRSNILMRLRVGVGDDVFADVDQEHQFNEYIQALEALRVIVPSKESPMSKIEFYTQLIRIDIRDRPNFLLGYGLQQSGSQRFEFVKTFSLSNSILNRRLQ